MHANTELIVALDFNHVEEAEKIISELDGLPLIYKVGLELFTAVGPAFVKNLVSRGKRVFLDLKLHDIPNTVVKTLLEIDQMGVELTTIHLSGGKKMLEMIHEEMPKDSKLKILGISVLTSFQEEDWISNLSSIAKLGAGRSIHDSVMHYAILANDHPAVHGLVCSSHEVKEVKAKYPELIVVVPGIRPENFDQDDQGRVMTPAEAAKAGATAVVVGRPITKSQHPRKIAEQILKDLS
jgi:orotidine-5'-phosphate decarboxylase